MSTIQQAYYIHILWQATSVVYYHCYRNAICSRSKRILLSVLKTRFYAIDCKDKWFSGAVLLRHKPPLKIYFEGKVSLSPPSLKRFSVDESQYLWRKIQIIILHTLYIIYFYTMYSLCHKYCCSFINRIGTTLLSLFLCVLCFCLHKQLAAGDAYTELALNKKPHAYGSRGGLVVN